jgi:hypothetical protein
MKKRLTFKQLLFEQQVLGILLFSVLVVFLWVISSIYFSYSTSTLSAEDELIVTPLNPLIDDKPLRALQNRRWWTDSELENFSVSATVKGADGVVRNTNIAAPVSTRSATASSSAQTQ